MNDLLTTAVQSARALPGSRAVPARAHVRTGVAVLEASAPLASFDFSTADRWHVLLLVEGMPVARVEIPSPGAVDSAPLARALLLEHAEEARLRHVLAARLRERLELPEIALPAPAISVVVCTHGRPAYLERLLAALVALDPPAHELIVVDNAPGARPCRAEAAAAGARYVREDRKGLDHARNAGLRAATGAVVAFTDDDCVPPPGWLAGVAAGFADPTVSAVTGPAFPYLLDTPARVRMERQAALSRGLRRRVYDWTVLPPAHGAQVGVGANMAFRRELLAAVADPFPAELDAGTATRSGGDTFVFARLLAAGHRIAYEPAAFTFHQHRPDWRALVDAVEGYGAGAAAAAAKLLVEDRELEAPRAWWWLVSQYARAQGRRLRRRGDAVEVRLAWGYLRGGLRGAAAWRRARAAEGRRRTPPFPPPTHVAAPGGGKQAGARSPRAPVPSDDAAIACSAIVPTVGRPEALERCLGALAGQTSAAAFEVIVCDDSPPGRPPVAFRAPSGLALVRLAAGGRGAAAARNLGAAHARGAVLLFLDDDLVPAADLIERHLAAHAAGRGPVVVGHSPPRPATWGLAASGAALWWEQQFAHLAAAPALGFMEMLSGNVSFARACFDAVGGFAESFGRHRREDWEIGLRLRRQGVVIAYEPRARADHEFRLDAAARLRACRGEGRGDALLIAAEQLTAAYLPVARHRPPTWRTPFRAAGFAVLAHDRTRPALLGALALLERLRLRSAWSGLYNRAQRAAYARGLREAGWRPGAGAAPPPRTVALDGADPIAAPADPVPPRLALEARGRRCGELLPPEASWHPWLADAMAATAPHGALAAMDRAAPHDAADALAAMDPAASREAEGAAEDVLADVGPSRPGAGEVVVLATGGAEDLRAAGVDVRRAPADPEGFWAAVDAALGEPGAGVVAIALPGRAPDERWLAGVRLAFSAPRVGALVGAALAEGDPVAPMFLAEPRRGRLPYTPLGPPPDFLALRPSMLRAAQRPAGLHAINELAPVAWWVEAALDGGALVAHRGLHGLGAPPRSAADRRADKLTAWAALLAASRQPGDAALVAAGLLWAPVVASRRLRGGAASGSAPARSAVALARGVAHGRRLRRAAGAPQAPPRPAAGAPQAPPRPAGFPAP